MSLYAKRFLIVKIFWVALFVIYFVFNFLFYFLDILNKRTSPSIGDYITYAFFLALVYFATISYAILQRHKPIKSILESFKIGIRKIYPLILPYISLKDFFPNFMAGINYYLGLIFGIIVIFPMLTLGRIILGKLIL